MSPPKKIVSGGPSFWAQTSEPGPASRAAMVSNQIRAKPVRAQVRMAIFPFTNGAKKQTKRSQERWWSQADCGSRVLRLLDAEPTQLVAQRLLGHNPDVPRDNASLIENQN